MIWIKSASLVAGAAPRRLTSSLADLSAKFGSQERRRSEGSLNRRAPPIRLTSAPLIVAGPR